jgi:hypothetical protein
MCPKIDVMERERKKLEFEWELNEARVNSQRRVGVRLGLKNRDMRMPVPTRRIQLEIQ